MENRPLLSICIPTYNREKYLKECLDSIINQDGFEKNKIEIVISDNASQDKTQELAERYQKQYKNIKYFKNNKNIGAILNVINISHKADWKYLWIIWDDDKILNWWLSKAYNIILEQKDIGWIFVNYSTYDERTSSTICKSQMNKMNEWCKFKIRDDQIIFIDWDGFYNYIDQTPTFLPSLIMKKDFFKDKDLKLFAENAYPHTGICTLNTKGQKIALITTPFVRWFVPQKNSWQKSGNALFDAHLDYLMMNHLVKNDNRCPFDEKKYKQYKKKFLTWYLKLIILSKALWFKQKKEHIAYLSMIFWKGLVFCFYLMPLLYLPLWKLFRILIPSKYFEQKDT